MSEPTDAGMQAIAQRFGYANPAAADEGSPGLELDAGAGLHLALGRLVSEMETDRRRKEQLARDVSYVTVPGQGIILAGGAGQGTPFWGPTTRYVWAVQRLTLAGFGATTDFINAYKGNSPSDAIAVNGLWTFQEAVAGGLATWHPGRTGLVLAPEEGLVFAGTFTGTQLVVSADVIQLATGKLPFFLL